MAENKNMESFITNAIENKTEEESKLKFDDEEMFGTPRIVIVGCGGAGGNTITRLNKLGVKGAETIAINTDKQALDLVEADQKLLIGGNITRGLGAGGFPEVAERARRHRQLLQAHPRLAPPRPLRHREYGSRAHRGRQDR